MDMTEVMYEVGLEEMDLVAPEALESQSTDFFGDNADLLAGVVLFGSGLLFALTPNTLYENHTTFNFWMSLSLGLIGSGAGLALLTHKLDADNI
jgi:hypothetical protein